MFSDLPETAHDFMDWSWSEIAPYYDDLASRSLTSENVADWLRDWTRLHDLASETYSRLRLASNLDTTDERAERRYHTFLEAVLPPVESAEQDLKQKLLGSRLVPEGFEVPLRKMRAEAELFREENLPLLTKERKLASEYDKIIGAQTVEWEGEEVTLPQLQPAYQETDRDVRERAWRLAAERQLADRDAISELWTEFMDVRRQLAENADKPNYRAFRWQQLLRFDYRPEDCARFHEAIEEVAVPAAERIYERRQQQLGIQSLRPWDLDVDPLNRPPLRPFETVEELAEKGETIFQRVAPQLGAYFRTMRQENLLDLDNRRGKAPGGYCTSFPSQKRPFIFMNAVGVDDDVQTLLHEAGHAFHVFERADLPYHQQRSVGAEFSEIASMAMELLSAPYLPGGEGGFYSEEEAARARVENLEATVRFWPYMATVDAFQHWVYENHDAASDPENCDGKWAELRARFMPGVDWSGLEDEMMTGWHRKLHIHLYPFYYVEYGLAQLGAVQVWHNALQNQAQAVAHYRQALALGGTVSIPELYKAAGAKLAFDADTMRSVVDLLERTIEELETER